MLVQTLISILVQLVSANAEPVPGASSDHPHDFAEFAVTENRQEAPTKISPSLETSSKVGANKIQY